MVSVSIKRSFVDPINQAINCAPVSPEQTREASQTKGLFVTKKSSDNPRRRQVFAKAVRAKIFVSTNEKNSFKCIF